MNKEPQIAVGFHSLLLLLDRARQGIQSATNERDYITDTRFRASVDRDQRLIRELRDEMANKVFPPSKNVSRETLRRATPRPITS